VCRAAPAGAALQRRLGEPRQQAQSDRGVLLPRSSRGCYPRTVTKELVLATALLLMMTLSPLSSATAQEVPMPPATFYGTATVNGHSVSDGTVVIALIDSKQCGEGQRDTSHKGTWTATEASPEEGIEAGDSLYVIDVVSDSQVPGCGTDGATVTFLVGGKPAYEKGQWVAGRNPLNLTAGILPTAGQPTATASAGQTPTSPADDAEASDDGGFNWWLVAVGGAAALAIVAIGAALWQVRRAARGKQA